MKQQGKQNVILHDAYFNIEPSLTGLFLFRLALLSAFSTSAALAIASLYSLSIDIQALCLMTAGTTAVLYTLMSVFPAWAVSLTILLGGGIFCAVKFDELAEKLSFFWDLLMLKLESRLLDTAPYLIHSREKLESGAYNDPAAEGFALFIILAIIALSLIVVWSCRTRIRLAAPVLFVAVFFAPAFVAEFAGFHAEMIPFIALLCALCVIRTDFGVDGLLVFGRAKAARESEQRSEKSYSRRTKFFILKKKLASDLPRYVKYNANALTAIIVTAAVVILADKLIPDGTGLDYRQLADDVGRISASVGENISEFFGTGPVRINDGGYFSYSSYGDGSGGIGIGAPVNGDAAVLEVRLDNGDVPVYLRGDIGVNFYGSGWTDIKGEYADARNAQGRKYSEIFKDFYPETQYRVLRQRLSAFGYEPEVFFPLRKVSVTYLQSTRVVFMPTAPYDLNYKDSRYFDDYGDTVLRTGYGSGYLKTYESLALVPDMDNSEMNSAVTSAFYGEDFDWTLPDGLTLAEYNEKIAQYRNYVYDVYRGTNEMGEKLHALLLSEGYVSSGMTDFEIAQGTCRYFKENFEYSLTVDNGTGEELLESFLFETKQGHCALFATAMTLAMRDMGFPARYVTGYVVTGGELQSDGTYLATLRENNLHAWVEVYFDNVGWLPFDPTAQVSGFGAVSAEETTVASETEDEAVISPAQTTPPAPAEHTTAASYSNDGEEHEQAASEEEEASETTIPPEQPVQDEHTAPSAAPEKDFGDIFVRFLPFIAAGVLIFAAAAIMFLFVRSVNEAEAKTLRGFRKSPPHRAAAEMYRLATAILRRMEAVPANELPDDFAQRVDEELLKGTKLFFTDVMPIFIKSEFGKQELSPVTEEERQACAVFTIGLYRFYMEKLNPLTRFFAKIALFL